MAGIRMEYVVVIFTELTRLGPLSSWLNPDSMTGFVRPLLEISYLVNRGYPDLRAPRDRPKQALLTRHCPYPSKEIHSFCYRRDIPI